MDAVATRGTKVSTPRMWMKGPPGLKQKRPGLSSGARGRYCESLSIFFRVETLAAPFAKLSTVELELHGFFLQLILKRVLW